MLLSLLDRVEIIVGKGENAGNFLLFLQCFQKPSLRGLIKVGIVWQRINKRLSLFLTLSQTSPGFYVSTVQVFWKHWK